MPPCNLGPAAVKRVKYVSKAEAAVGLLSIDWQNRTVMIEGLSGENHSDAMTQIEVLHCLRKDAVEQTPQTVLFGIAVDFGNYQLALHDLDSYMESIYGPQEPGACILTPENIATEDDCTTHDHEES